MRLKQKTQKTFSSLLIEMSFVAEEPLLLQPQKAFKFLAEPEGTVAPCSGFHLPPEKAEPGAPPEPSFPKHSIPHSQTGGGRLGIEE